MAPPVVELLRIEHDFGERRVLRGVELRVEPGASLALFGENGAGKTTLLRVVAGLLAADERRGTARRDVPAPAAGPALRGRIGFLSHRPLVWGGLTASENLRARRAPVRARRRRRRAQRSSEWASPTGPACGLATSRRASASASAWPVRSLRAPTCCCSTSRTPGSTPTGSDAPRRAARGPARLGDDPARHARPRARPPALRQRADAARREARAVTAPPGTLRAALAPRPQGPAARGALARSCSPASGCSRWRALVRAPLRGRRRRASDLGGARRRRPLGRAAARRRAGAQPCVRRRARRGHPRRAAADAGRPRGDLALEGACARCAARRRRGRRRAAALAVLLYARRPRTRRSGPLVAALALADVGLAAVGALVAALASPARLREVLLPRAVPPGRHPAR